jgi:hypothetical protein
MQTKDVFRTHIVFSVLIILVSALVGGVGIYMQFFSFVESSRWSSFQTFFALAIAIILLRIPFIWVECCAFGIELHIWPWWVTKIEYLEIKRIVKMTLPYPCLVVYFTRGVKAKVVAIGPLGRSMDFLKKIQKENPGIAISK